MTVLVTRGWHGAERTAAALRQMGIDPIISPVLDIRFRPTLDVDLTNVQALVFTSANGVGAWGPRCEERNLPVYAVAKTTAQAARDIGFQNVTAGKGNVLALTSLIKAEINPKEGALLHIRGTHIAGNLAGDLKFAGYDIKECIGYDTVTVDRLSEEAIAAIVSGTPVRVLIHSPRGAKSFLELIKRFGLLRWISSITIYGISENVLKPLQSVGFNSLNAAISPDEESLLNLLNSTEELAQADNAS